MEPVADALGAVLARRIVERSMHRLGHNVNVMDSAGVIIGSGDGSRLGQVHEGALLAIRGGRTVAVDAAMAERVVGVRPGINVPLVVEGRTVGAVGVTGDPERLREAADLLRMAAELMIEQAGALDDEQWRSSRLDALARDMVSSDVDQEILERRADALDVDVLRERVVLLVVPRAGHGEEVVREARRVLHRSGLDLVTSLLEPDLLLVLSGTADTDAVVRSLGRTRERVEVAVGTRDGSGRPGEALAASFASALDVLAARRAPGPGQAVVVHRWDDDPLTALVAGLPDDWRGRALGLPWRRLIDADETVASTVVAYLESGGDLTLTAERLHVHRNTLRHRLDRAAQLCGVDVRDPRGAAHLMVGAVRDGRLCMRTTSSS